MFAKMQQSTDNSTTFRTEASYLEIYNEKVKDLLGPDANGAHGLKVTAKKLLAENHKSYLMFISIIQIIMTKKSWSLIFSH